MSLKNQQLIQIYQFQQSTPFQHDKALMHRLGAFIITQCFKPEANDSNKEMKTDKLQTQIKIHNFGWNQNTKLLAAAI